MLNLSGFVAKGSSDTTASQAVALFGTNYSAGDYLTSTYHIDNFKLSLQDLFFPFPRKEDQRWRVKTLWELQYDNISTSVNAPFAPNTDSSGNPVDNSVKGSRFVVYPTFGLAGEYHLTKNVALHVTGSGFAIPHHSAIGDAEGSISDRIGPMELIGAYKYYHFKTSAQNDEYFKTTLDGAYVAVRWYPEKLSVPCPFCRGGSTTTAKNDGTNAPPSSGAQAPNQTALASGTSRSPAANAPAEVTYVRRFSGGATVSVLGLSLIPNSTSTVNNSADVSTQYQTQGASSRIGYGLTGQVALTDRFAVAVEGLVRRIGYQLTTTTTTNATVNAVTTTTTTRTHEDTRARLIDVPAALLFYNRGRHTPGGARFFLEGGGAFRDAGSIWTSLSSTDSSGNLTCCTDTPTRPIHKNVEGVVGGVGLLLIDPVGIHLIPEVRYTHWMNPTFDAFTTSTNRNEVAAGFSLSF